MNHLPQGVDGRAIDRPLRDAHLAQVRTGVARQTFTVLKIFSAELTADVPGGLRFMVDSCGKAEKKDTGCIITVLD